MRKTEGASTWAKYLEMPRSMICTCFEIPRRTLWRGLVVGKGTQGALCWPPLNLLNLPRSGGCWRVKVVLYV